MTLQRFSWWSALVVLAAVSLAIAQPGAGGKAGILPPPKSDDKKKALKIDEVKFPDRKSVV